METEVDKAQKTLENKETVYCSSDMAESCFGKYKELVKNNKATGISDLSLSIAALLGNLNTHNSILHENDFV
jgi:hypothetical protein